MNYRLSIFIILTIFPEKNCTIALHFSILAQQNYKKVTQKIPNEIHELYSAVIWIFRLPFVNDKAWIFLDTAAESVDRREACNRQNMCRPALLLLLMPLILAVSP